MARIKNISTLGAVIIPALGVSVAAGATFDVADEDVAASLLGQNINFKPADKASVSLAPAEVTTDNTDTPAPEGK